MYEGVGHLVAGIADGFSLTFGLIEDECVDSGFQMLMDDSYYYAVKATSEFDLNPIDTSEPGLV